MNLKTPLIALTLSSLATASYARTSSEAHLTTTPADANRNINHITHMNGGNGVSLQIDLLIWKTTEEGLDFAINDRGSPNANLGYSTTAIVDGKTYAPQHDWQPGFKVAAGYQLPHDGWDLLAQWSYIHPFAKRELAAEKNGFVRYFATQSSPILTQLDTPYTRENISRVFSANCHFHMTANIIDAELGKEYTPQNTPWFSIRPHFGVRYANITQTSRITYQHDLDPTAIPNREDDTKFFNHKVKKSQAYWGIGVRGGFDTEFNMRGGVSFFGKLATSVLCGKYAHIQHKENLYAPSGLAFENQVFKTSNNFFATKGVTDLECGLMYEKMLSENEVGYTIKAGWEQHMYYGHNQMTRFTDSQLSGNFHSEKGDLGFSGLNISVKFDF